MATPAQIAANRANAAHSTGAVTPEGKARSAANSISFGLFTAAARVEPGEEAEYADFTEAFRNKLDPEGPVEELLVAEVTIAAWRLRRCGIVESKLPECADPEATQIAVDRARNQAHRLFLKGIAELGKLQTDRQLRLEVLPDSQNDPGLVNFRDIVRDLSVHTAWQLAKRRLEGVETVEKVIERTMPGIFPGEEAEAEMKETVNLTPRSEGEDKS
jgi:hypothetical protein